MELRTVISALYGDGSEQIIYESASEYGEPGYHSDGPVLMGDWWCRRADCSYPERYEDGKRKVHALEYHYPRIFAFLEEKGCALEWYDEWVVPTDSDKAYRTEADSYSWEPTAIWNEDIADYMVPDDGIEIWLEWAVNNASRALMSHAFSDAELAAEGFVERQCDYESGWYGVEDDPRKIMEAIQAREDVDVLFKLSGHEQFRVTFCVYVRERATDEGEEE